MKSLESTGFEGTVMLIERTISEGTINLCYQVGEQLGPPMVFLHGVGRGGRDFLGFAETIPIPFQPWLLDFRGHGGSGPMGSDYRVIDYADDVQALLVQIGRPVVLYGHSLGALVASAIASRHPESVHAIVLEDPPGHQFLSQLSETAYHPLFSAMRRLAGSGNAASEIAAELAEVKISNGQGGWIRFGDTRDPQSIRLSAEFLVSVDPNVYSPILERRWLDGYDFQTIRSGINCPSLLMQADDRCGSMMTQGDAQEWAQSVKNCTLVRFPGVGHHIRRSAGRELMPVVESFLKSALADKIERTSQ